MFKNIHVKMNEFINYQEKYGTTYLDKKNGYRIHSPSKSKLLGVNEMLDGIHTVYELLEDKVSGDYKINFKSKSGIEYRFDLFKDLEDDFIYHLGFSLSNNVSSEYDNLSDKNEASEVFGRLSYILTDVNKKLNISWYCIGATGNEKKDSLYLYFMKYVKTWEKREIDEKIYKLGWALYFQI